VGQQNAGEVPVVDNASNDGYAKFVRIGEMVDTLLAGVERLLDPFMQWLERYGEKSWDHQTYFAGPVGRWAKHLYYKNRSLGTIAVAPMIISEAVAPWARPLFGARYRFPIADAHYAMAFAYLARVRADSTLHGRAVHFLEELERSRCVDYPQRCWGYPFDWETRTGTIRQGTPLITTTPYVYEAFRAVYTIDGTPRWRETLDSIAQHATEDIKDFPAPGGGSTCSYTPFDQGGVVNASAYRACLLANAAVDLDDDRYWQIAQRNVEFVLGSQNADGSWYYSVEGARDFVDHFHTCFVLKALAKIERLNPDQTRWRAIEKGAVYYLRHLVDEQGLPKPFSRAPRTTVYRRELYDYAECVNLCVLLRNRIPGMNSLLKRVLADLLARWVKSDGSFRSRELWVGWDNVPMHRWAQSQMFRSLCLFVLDERGEPNRDVGRTSDVRNLRAV
jgi:hypothetical protein